MILALLCAVVQGAWAQSSWDEVYAITQTNSANWTQLTEESTTGKTLGTAGSTTYYYADTDLTFSNSTVSGSGLTIRGTVYFYVPDGVTVTCTGAHANGQMGGGAGIELTEGNTLYLLGSGTLNATGGNAADGSNGGNGGDAYLDYNNDYLYSGTGGNGGNGGGGAGAGIGTRGGNGGAGGAGGLRHERSGASTWSVANGNNGSAGSAGTSAGAVGQLYRLQSLVNLNAKGGSIGNRAGAGGSAGWSALWDGTRNWSAPGGGGGGGGGYGGGACDIGTGGPGGGGGGGGAGGCLDWKDSGYYFYISAGGAGGNNGKPNTTAPTGEQAEVSPKYLENGKCGTNGSFDDDDVSYGVGSATSGTGGAGGAKGNNSVGGTTTFIVYSGAAVTFPTRIQVCGTAELNLGEGATLMAKKGIEVSKGNSLTINGPGALTIDGCDENKSGIGAFEVGIITINGGTINVRGGVHGAGIGGDEHNEDGGTIIINGGVVTAQGAGSAAGIGGGCGDYTTDGISRWGRCGNIIINGGQVTARGGDETAGIGPGFSLLGSNSGKLTLGWTNAQEDFIYCSGFKSGSNYYGKITLYSITFAEGKQFVIDGTATIATSSNIGGKKIVPYTTEQLPLSGAGTLENPWRITSAADWNVLAQNIIAGNSYSGEYVQLDADIEIAGGVGGHDENGVNGRPFSGTFLGNNKTITAAFSSIAQGAAPFRYISGATIKNLTVAGTITSDQYYTSGLVGFADGENLIEGCIVSATINQNSDYAGGFVGNGKTSTTTIRGCIFQGTVNGSIYVVHRYNGGYRYETTHNVCGFWGYGDEGSTLIMQNCLEKGTYNTISGMHPIGLQNGTSNLTNTHYLTPQSGPLSHTVVSGAYRAYSVNTAEGEMLSPLQLLDGNTYYTPCIITFDDPYKLEDNPVSVTPVVKASDETTLLTLGTDYTATVDGTEVTSYPMSFTSLGIKTFTITGLGNCNGSTSASFIVIRQKGEGTPENPYTISNTDEWDAFVYQVNLGNSYSGKYVKLMDDIDISSTVGVLEDKPFSGTFNGGGHTITATINDNSDSGTAPFRYIKTATIKNLTVAGTITSNQRHMSGLVGFADSEGEGKNLIEGCAVTATLNINTDYAGGIIGHGKSSATTIRGCVFAGTMNASGNPNVGVIWGWSNSGTPALENCLEAGTYTGISKLHPMGLQKAAGTITNCYYTTPQIGSPENACTVSGATKAYPMSTAPYYLGGQVQDYGLVKAYENGILYGGKYYMAPAIISLADNADNSTTISDNDGLPTNVTLQSRTLYRDGDWNTLCLPFSLDNIYGTCLQGATVKTLESTSFTGGTLTMNFTENVNGIEAGKPYIVKWKPVDLSTLTTHYTAQDGETLTGTLGGDYKISIAAGATVKLQDVTINGTKDERYSWAGISCLGNATIILKGTNTMKGFYLGYPGIHVPSGSTLTIKGSGSLTASGRGDAAGIGGGTRIPCGNIVIEGGTINAYGGFGAAGIGGGRYATCGDITITDGVTKVYAERGAYVGAIGRGDESTCGTVTIGGEVKNITASTYTYTGTGSGSVDVAVPNLVNPVFKNVFISDAKANVETDYVDFIGTYSPVSIYTDEKTNLYLGADNKLYYPTATDFTVNAFRGYFQLKLGDNEVKAFKLYFGDDEATGIISVHDSGFMVNGSDAWYTLDGRKLDGKPTRAGVYINNGRKVVIK